MEKTSSTNMKTQFPKLTAQLLLSITTSKSLGIQGWKKTGRCWCCCCLLISQASALAPIRQARAGLGQKPPPRSLNHYHYGVQKMGINPLSALKKVSNFNHARNALSLSMEVKKGEGNRPISDLFYTHQTPTLCCSQNEVLCYSREVM